MVDDISRQKYLSINKIAMKFGPVEWPERLDKGLATSFNVYSLQKYEWN